jgi:hypothetical protein
VEVVAVKKDASSRALSTIGAWIQGESVNDKQQLNPWMIVAAVVIGYLVLTRNQPTPSPTPGPDERPIPVVDAKLVEGSRVALKGLVDAMAADMEAAAKDVASGVQKTVSEVALASTKRDTDTRDAFKRSMAELMKTRLGDSDLKPGADAVFRDIASGFRKVTK